MQEIVIVVFYDMFESLACRYFDVFRKNKGYVNMCDHILKIYFGYLLELVCILENIGLRSERLLNDAIQLVLI